MDGNAGDHRIPEGFNKALRDLPSACAWLAPAARHVAECDPELIEDGTADLGPVAAAVTGYFRDRGERAFDENVASFGVWLDEQPDDSAHLPLHTLYGLLLQSNCSDWEALLAEPAVVPPTPPDIDAALPKGWKAKHKPGLLELRVTGGPKLVMIVLVPARDLDSLVGAQLQGPSELVLETARLGAWSGSVLIVRPQDIGGVEVGGATTYFLRADQQAWAIHATHSGVHGADLEFDRVFASILASVRFTPGSG